MTATKLQIVRHTPLFQLAGRKNGGIPAFAQMALEVIPIRFGHGSM